MYVYMYILILANGDDNESVIILILDSRPPTSFTVASDSVISTKSVSLALGDTTL